MSIICACREFGSCPPRRKGRGPRPASVPQVIYTIPPSSPVYNVTYVTQVTTQTATSVQLHRRLSRRFRYWRCRRSHRGQRHRLLLPALHRISSRWISHLPSLPTPYGAYGAYGSTSYYHTGTGAYGVSQTAYGAYGSATRSASYNPYTGTASRSASVSTPYGKQSVGQAYNPYTGTYGATHQGSSPTAQWGQSYVLNGNHSATTQHYSTAKGTVASAQARREEKATLLHRLRQHRRGQNVKRRHVCRARRKCLQNTGSGWQKSNGGGSWSSVNTQQTSRRRSKVQKNYNQQHSNSQASAHDARTEREPNSF